MEYRTLAGTELTLSALTFGAWAAGGWMWGTTERKDALEAIRASYDNGITSIDTAPIYGQGNSEEIVGEAIAGIPRDKVQILTKFGMRWDEDKGRLSMKTRDLKGNNISIHIYASKESIIRECEDSLRRLKTDYIDLYQIHWPDPTTPIAESFEAVNRLIEQGKVRYAGVSNYNAAQMAEAEKTTFIASNQIPYSMVNRRIEKETLPWCIEHNKSILAYSPLERGLLTGKLKPGHEFAEGDHRATNSYFTDDSIERTNAFLAKLKPMANAKNATLSQLVLRWTIEQPGITIALVGARNAEQAIQNAAAINVKLTSEEIRFINGLLPPA
ncbi:aldo/keto reductase [Oxalobacter sp. OttesenSCG-928-P03]|nr:aldo/keto reductase [Oxalobacter sp. OttesenSCG-928-P03]